MVTSSGGHAMGSPGRWQDQHCGGTRWLPAARGDGDAALLCRGRLTQPVRYFHPRDAGGKL